MPCDHAVIRLQDIKGWADDGDSGECLWCLTPMIFDENIGREGDWVVQELECEGSKYV